MKYNDGTTIEEEDFIAIFPRRIDNGKNYEVWQHAYFKSNVLAENFDLQLVYFIDEKSVESYHITQDKERFQDANHLARLQLIYHDVCENFEEHSILVKDIWSDEASINIEEIIREKNKSNAK